jgi:sulfur relay (sulfurtransferase) DsrC/TusE family protein
MEAPMAEELEFVGYVGKCMSDPRSYKSDLDRWREPMAKTIASHALAKLEEARKKDVEAHERNLPKIEVNKAIRENIVAVMKEAGIPDSYSERDTKSRARFPKSIRHDAGYLGDLNRNVKIADGFEPASWTYNSLKARYDEYARQAEEEDARRKADQEREEAAALERRRNDLKLAEIILRHGLVETTDWDAALDALRCKDQRLDLAAAMYQTRGDWSDGYYRVSDALGRFTVTTPEDAAIQTDILSCFNDDIDGRIFRDTTWNYSRLFAEAEDQQLSKDVQTALENVRTC